MILGIADDYDAASAGFDFVALGDAVGGVVGAFGVKIGTDLADDGADVFFGENDDGIYVGQRRQNFRAFFGEYDGASFTFQRAGGGVGVHGDDEFASEFASRMEVADVADVEDVEAAVRECDASAGAAPCGDSLLQFVARDNLRVRMW